MSTKAGSPKAQSLQRPHRGILRWTIFHRISALVLLVISSSLQKRFDTSSDILILLDPTSRPPILALLTNALVRWDSVHFLGAASPRPLPLPPLLAAATYEKIEGETLGAGGGLQYEHSLAFQPGILWLLRLAGYSFGHRDLLSGWSPSRATLVVSLISATISSTLPLLLYELTLSHTRNRGFSKIAAYLSILSTSPSTLITPTPEAFFGLFALLGQLSLSPGHHRGNVSRLKAAAFFSLATLFRVNGVLFAGFILWDLLWTPWKRSNRKGIGWQMLMSIILAPLLIIMSVFPFMLSQVWAWKRFCYGVSSRSWCKNLVPLVYPFIQEHYWNVAPFRYWTWAQLPNFAFALPVLGFSFHWLNVFYRSNWPEVVRHTFKPWTNLSSSPTPEGISARSSELVDIETTPSLLPHAHFALLNLILLVVNSHVQISLRFASPGGLPAVWWGAAHLVLHSSRNAHRPLNSHKSSRLLTRVVLAYLISWNIASIILYAGFYPPA